MKKNFVLGVIPARLTSSRLPKKLMMPINGKPLLWHTFERAKKSRALDDLIIATDSIEISRAAQSWGCSVVMTSSKHKTGTDRIAEAVLKYRGGIPSIVINIQGDEPLMPASLITKVAQKMIDNPSWDAAAAATTTYTMENLLEPSVVKVSSNTKEQALYFSRSLIPFHHTKTEKPGYLAIIGLMAFRAPFLQKFKSLQRRPLERVESVEQLRIVEHGYKCGLVSGTYDVLGVNTYEEYMRVKELLESKNK